ncbi:unnamed protein product, partial [Ectocarpus sp. 12 AP-2014]
RGALRAEAVAGTRGEVVPACPGGGDLGEPAPGAGVRVAGAVAADNDVVAGAVVVFVLGGSPSAAAVGNDNNSSVCYNRGRRRCCRCWRSRRQRRLWYRCCRPLPLRSRRVRFGEGRRNGGTGGSSEGCGGEGGFGFQHRRRGRWSRSQPHPVVAAGDPGGGGCWSGGGGGGGCSGVPSRGRPARRRRPRGKR